MYIHIICMYIYIYTLKNTIMTFEMMIMVLCSDNNKKC